MADHAGETVAETTRRLQAESAGTTPAAKKRGRPSVVFTIVLVAIIVGGVVIAGIAGTVSSLSGPDGPLADDWSRYPGTYSTDPREVLASASKEEVLDDVYALQEEFRDRLRDEYGFIWIQDYPERIEPEDNGYGGESMLVQYDSGNWATTVPITDYDLKLEVLDVIDEVLAEYEFWSMIAFNEPSSGFDPAYIERLYGSANPRTQSLWESYTDNDPGPILFYATISDLTHDDDGRFRAAREGQVAGTQEPIEGLLISVLIPEVLSEADVEEFQRRMEDYPGG